MSSQLKHFSLTLNKMKSWLITTWLGAQFENITTHHELMAGEARTVPLKRKSHSDEPIFFFFFFRSTLMKKASSLHSQQPSMQHKPLHTKYVFVPVLWWTLYSAKMTKRQGLQWKCFSVLNFWGNIEAKYAAHLSTDKIYNIFLEATVIFHQVGQCIT